MSAATRILVIDDDPAILRTLSTNLRARGYDVSAVETGEEGVHRFEEGGCDLVILDLMLPGLSGLDVCRTIRSRKLGADTGPVGARRGADQGARARSRRRRLPDEAVSVWTSCWHGSGRCCAGRQTR